jgi:hypothetical protein
MAIKPDESPRMASNLLDESYWPLALPSNLL